MQVILHACNFVPHGLAMGDDQTGPLGNTLALSGQAVKSLPASTKENWHTEFEFKLFDPGRETGLGLHYNSQPLARNVPLQLRRAGI